MNQWETETVEAGLALFTILSIIFLFTRKRWARSVTLPTTLFVLNCAWLVSAIVYRTTERFVFLEGVPFAIAYSVVIFMSPVIVAAGILEAVVIVYHLSSIKTSWPTLALQRHSLAFLSAAFCFCVYLYAHNLITR
jgi:hypothetical protein